jgi:hypothetical protein
LSKGPKLITKILFSIINSFLELILTYWFVIRNISCCTKSFGPFRGGRIISFLVVVGINLIWIMFDVFLEFIELVSNKWDDWMKEIWFLPDGCKHINMVLDNLEDEIRHLKAVEHGEVAS